MLVVDDLGILNTHLALSGANRDIVSDKKECACEDVYIQVIDNEGIKSELVVSTG